MTDKKTCFVIMPVTTSKEMEGKYGDPEHFLHVFECLHAPALRAAGLEPIRPSAAGSELIHTRIVKGLIESDLVLCDMTTLNANVFMELGIRTALNKRVCVIADKSTELPFDTGNIHTHFYQSDLRAFVLKEEQKRLREHIENAMKTDDGNAWWKTFAASITAEAVEANDVGDMFRILFDRFDNLERSFRREIGDGSAWDFGMLISSFENALQLAVLLDEANILYSEVGVTEEGERRRIFTFHSKADFQKAAELSSNYDIPFATIEL